MLTKLQFYNNQVRLLACPESFSKVQKNQVLTPIEFQLATKCPVGVAWSLQVQKTSHGGGKCGQAKEKTRGRVYGQKIQEAV